MAVLDADTIVIGSGSGGLASGLSLARTGEKVLVLEQHYVPGGWCHSFSKEGFSFCPGVHYLGRLGPGHENNLFYEQMGIGDLLTFYQMNPDGYEHCMIEGTRFDYSADYNTLTKQLIERFPHEAKGISKYQTLLKHLMDEFNEIFRLEKPLDYLTMPYRTRHIGRYGLYSLDRILKARINDPIVRGILSVQCGDQGLPPSKTMFMLHVGVARHYEYGGYYPKGGGRSIVQAMVKGIQRHGGKVKRGARVQNILIEGTGKNRRAIGVRLSDGQEYRANNIISNADPHKTFYGMVGADHLSKKLRKRLDQTTYSVGSLNLFLAVNMDLRGAGLDSGNIWYSKHAEFEGLFQKMMSADLYQDDEFGSVFVSSPTLKDPSSLKNGVHTLEVVTFVGYEPFRKFADTDSENRPEEYKALKNKVIEMFYKALDHIIPGFREHVVFSDLGTPVTNSHYINSTNGSVYGTEKSYKQIGPMAYRNKTEIDGLYLAGASTSSHGVLGAAMSGVQAAASIKGCDTKELLKGSGPKVTVLSAEPSL